MVPLKVITRAQAQKNRVQNKDNIETTMSEKATRQEGLGRLEKKEELLVETGKKKPDWKQKECTVRLSR